MKDPFDRTKVVLRQLPPALSESALMEQIDGRFSGRYKWFCFRSGKNSHKHQRYSRAYIDFKRPEDVVEFAEFFDGHVFVNEKGTQYKTVVEYAPSQRVPKSWPKKDGREGTIVKDPEYLEFLELLSKPVENLPSAEIQLERREAERAGAPKETPVVTPLMDFVRQKRAAKGSSSRSSSNGKLSRRCGGSSPGNSSSASTKRGSEKRRVSTSMYVLRDSVKNTSGKDKSTHVLVPRREDKQSSYKSVFVAAAVGTEALDDESVASTDGSISGVTDAADTGKKRVILLKGKDREISQTSGGVLKLNAASPVRNSPGSTASRQNQRREASGKMIRSILLNKEARQSQSSIAVQSEQQVETLNSDRDKRPPRPNNVRLVVKEHVSSTLQAANSSERDAKSATDDKIAGSDLYVFDSTIEKQEKRTRNKDRPDRGVWTPLRRSDGLHASDESLSSSASQTTQLLSDSLEGMTITEHDATGVSQIGDDVMGDTVSSYRSSISSAKSRVGRGGNSSSVFDLSVNHDVKVDMPNTSRSVEAKPLGSGRISFSLVENGTYRHTGPRVPHVKDADGSLNVSEGKPSKRGGATGYGTHEKQIWVQKSGSGS